MSDADGATPTPSYRVLGLNLAATAFAQHVERAAVGLMLHICGGDLTSGQRQVLRRAVKRSQDANLPDTPQHDPLEALLAQALLAGLSEYELMPAYLRRDATTLKLHMLENEKE